MERFGEEFVRRTLEGSVNTRTDVESLFGAVTEFAGNDGLVFDTTVASVAMIEPTC